MRKRICHECFGQGHLDGLIIGEHYEPICDRCDGEGYIWPETKEESLENEVTMISEAVLMQLWGEERFGAPTIKKIVRALFELNILQQEETMLREHFEAVVAWAIGSPDTSLDELMKLYELEEEHVLQALQAAAQMIESQATLIVQRMQQMQQMQTKASA